MGINGPTKPNKTGHTTPNDRVMTPVKLAQWIVDYFNPTGSFLEPCKGDGSFYIAAKEKVSEIDWCEITEGKDFLTHYGGIYDWIITNPPFSLYDAFLLKSFSMAMNVVFLAPLAKAFKSQKIDKAIQEFGGLKEIVLLGSGGTMGFPFGFPTGCLWYKKNYCGDVKLTRAYGEWKIK